ncbi:protein translocase subunit SecF [Microlunatus elymi]|uniref:Protein-export membrane protein SecF n=1 Tax=Microlunatus elymi TaxID=2596828 RepID=A0A516Q030_9ACTN|nr:protein translocase subunit SecF [Microlunatus elymi]QDP96778.1 protein translocase subunit SecF [Microlunatus elymi]
MSKLGQFGHRLYTGEVSYDFVGKRRRWFIISAVALLIVIIGFAFRGLNLGIEFTGGAEFQVPVASANQQTVQKVETALDDSGIAAVSDATVTQVGKSTIRVETEALNSESEVPQVKKVLADATGANPNDINYSLIGASWGSQITERGIIALVVFLVLVSVLLWAYMRNAKMAAAALVALLHDLVITIGVYAVVGFSFTPESLIGMLTILGYSLYDTVVVFDKVRENTRNLTGSSRSTYSEAANLAVNQTLVRSINTTIIGVLPVAALLFAGGVILHTGPLKDLSLALFVGMISGAYSSIFIATPLLAAWKEREPDMIRQRKRVAARRARDEERAGENVPAGARRSAARRRAAAVVADQEDTDVEVAGRKAGSDSAQHADSEDTQAEERRSTQSRSQEPGLPADGEVAVGNSRITLSVRGADADQSDARRDRLSEGSAKRPQPQRKPRSERKK